MPVMLAQTQNPLATKKGLIMGVSTDELIAYYPVCKSFETDWYSGYRLVQSRKFRQEDSHVLHECGSKEPCHLYRNF